MKTYFHNYKGYGVHSSTCKVYIKETENSILVGFENLGIGTSVTNASEQLATEIVQLENLNPEKCRFFEWYSEYEGNVDEIVYSWNGLNAFSPSWISFCSFNDNPFNKE